MNWLAAFFAQVMMKLIPWLISKGMEFYHKEQDVKAAGESIDERLKAVKDAYQKAFNGEPITPEQRTELHRAISDFIRGGTTIGL